MFISESRTVPRYDFQVPWSVSAGRAGFRPLSPVDYERILPFYSALIHPLADLNALMMIAWRKALALHVLIDDQVLYMLAQWNGAPVFWGPPIGNVRLKHIYKAFDLLHACDPTMDRPSIRYFWEDYPLWPEIIANSNLIVKEQSREYLYDVLSLATLSSPRLKKKRNAYKTFKVRFSPTVMPYSPELAGYCLKVLETWGLQKARRIPSKYRSKFELEKLTCETALHERLPLSGVVALVNGKAEAFSIGGAHGEDTFNCMFEKTNLEMRGASAFIFSELAKSCLGSYGEINAGEDWEVDYLQAAKKHWEPSHVPYSYQLCKD